MNSGSKMYTSGRNTTSGKIYLPKQIFSTGSDGLNELAALDSADWSWCGGGCRRFGPTLAALEAGKDVVLANKESLVVGGQLVMETAHRTGAKILPADSEHNGVFQCLHGQPEKSLDSIILTASGGPFRDFSLEQLSSVTPEQALKHPNWSMGPKLRWILPPWQIRDWN